MYVVTQKFCQEVRDRLDIEVREDYSGRFMYGRNCFGIVGGAGELMKFALELPKIVADQAVADDADGVDIDDIEVDVDEEWQEVRWDNMGRDLIFYWPNIMVAEDSIEYDESATLPVTPNSAPDWGAEVPEELEGGVTSV